MSTRRNATLLSDSSLLDRPLTARSVVLSLLLGRATMAAPVALLVRWCALFGVSEGATRVALSRSVALGELATTDGSYRIVGRLAERKAEQDAALAHRAGTDRWDGTWKLALVEPGRRSADDRAALRLAAGRLHLVELREGVWGRPDNLGDRSPSPSSEPVVAEQCRWWTGARPPGNEAELVARLFETSAACERGRQLLDRLRSVTDDLRDEPRETTLAESFTIGAAAAQFLRRDPLLPAELLPASWPAPALRNAYHTYQQTFTQALTTWSRTTA